MLLQRERPRAPAQAPMPAPLGGTLPPPAPLPSLQAAFSRRAAILSAGLALAACSPAKGRATSPGDDTLVALGAEVDRTLDGAAYALEHVRDDADQNRRIGHADALLRRMSSIPAQSGRGLNAKAKAFLDGESYDVQELHEVAASLAHDIERLHRAGGLA